MQHAGIKTKLADDACEVEKQSPCPRMGMTPPREAGTKTGRTVEGVNLVMVNVVVVVEMVAAVEAEG